MSDEKHLNEGTHHPDILDQGGINVPQAFNADATDGDSDGFVQDGTEWMRPVESVASVEPVAVAVEPETLPVVIAEPAPEENRAIGHSTMKAEAPVVEEPAPAAAAKRNKGKKSSTSAVIPTEIEEGSVVLLSKLVFQSITEQNSNSVRVVQARLMEHGYITAGDDKPGWVSTGTAEALEDYKKDNGIEADSIYAEDVIKSLFVGTSVQVLP